MAQVLLPHTGGATVPFRLATPSTLNHLNDEGEDRAREAYGAQTWERLVAAKRRYDPANLFRMNQNVRSE